MKLLVVEGNNEETRFQREAFGIIPYHKLFTQMLNFLNPLVEVKSVFPADDDKNLPTRSQLQNYDGVLWTGSSLSVLDNTPYVNRQLEFAEDLFQSGVPFYGSCWGMQIATVVSGGKVGLSNSGLEFGLSESIQITDEGKSSPFFKDRTNNYKALCIHFDEVVDLPDNSIILAYNRHSKVQAMTIDYKNSLFFGVQYHPEFRTNDMGLIASFLADKLVEKGCFESISEVSKISKQLIKKMGLPKEVSNYKLHTQEINSWLNFIAKR